MLCGFKAAVVIIHNPAAGVQPDVGALPMISRGGNEVSQQQLGLIACPAECNGDGAGAVGIFCQIGIKIIKCPAEQVRVDLHIPLQRLKVGVHGESVIFQGKGILIPELIEQGVGILRFQVRLLTGGGIHQEIFERRCQVFCAKKIE